MSRVALVFAIVSSKMGIVTIFSTIQKRLPAVPINLPIGGLHLLRSFIPKRDDLAPENPVLVADLRNPPRDYFRHQPARRLAFRCHETAITCTGVSIWPIALRSVVTTRFCTLKDRLGIFSYTMSGIALASLASTGPKM